MSAVDELQDLFNSYGLDTLAQWLADQIIAGRTPEQIITDLRNQPEYKERFPAMDALIKFARDNNMPVMNEATYLQMETSYRLALSNSGLPPGMFDSADDFKRILEAQVDPQEVAERVAAAKVAVDQTDPYVRSQLREMYGITSTDLMAYALDPARGSEYIRKVATSSLLAGLSQRQGMFADAGSWERYAQDAINQGLQQQQIVEAAANAATLSQTQGRLASIEGEDFTTQEAYDIVLSQNAAKALKSQQRARRERTRFAASSGLTAQSMEQTKSV